MRQKIQHIALLSVVLLCFALDGVGQVWQYECGNTVFDCLGPINFSTGKRAVGAYDYHIGDRGWECPYVNYKERTTEWRDLGTDVVKYAHGLTKVTGGGFTGYESKISTLSTTSGGVHVIVNGGAFVFTDDGGIAGKYLEGKSYRFRVKSENGLPLRVRAYEFAARPWDTLSFYEVDRNGNLELIKMYGHQSACPGGRKDKCPIDYPQVIKSKCGGQPWSRSFKHNPPPKNIEYTDPKTGIKKIEQSDIIFTIPSGECEIAWGVGHKVMGGSSSLRAGWVMVVDVLSAKVKSISLSEVAECKPDNIAVTYDVYVGAKNQNAKEVRFNIENEQTGLVLDTTVYNVNSANNPNTMTFNSKRLGGAGNYKVRITSVSDDWSSAPVSSEVSGSVSLRVKPNPSLILTDTTICSGQEGRVRLMAKDHTIPFRVIAESEENGVFVFAWTQDINKLGAKPGFGPLHWRSGSSYTDTYSYRIRIVNLENNQEQCGSNWFNYNVNVLKIPETGEQYHVPN